MTKFLSEALAAPEPFFRHGLRRLESANGHPNTDIRFSTEVVRDSRATFQALGLDPKDTTPEELYHALQERVKADDAQLVKTLRTKAASTISAEARVVDGMVLALQSVTVGHNCYALKASKLRQLLKKIPPKKASKQLGYRSLDSFLKHEPALLALTAAWVSEGESWQQRLHEQYKKLTPADFEMRPIAVVQPMTARWEKLASSVVADKKHNVFSFKELGGIVLLPFSTEVPEGATLASLALALHALNEIRAGSTYLKLCQVRPDFGSMVQTVSADEPKLLSGVLEASVPWHLIQRYYARLNSRFHDALFEPHIQREDMVWYDVETALKTIEPALATWQRSAHHGLVHGSQVVSCNVIDAALNFCNNLPFEKRLIGYFQKDLWHELLLAYLKHDTVEQTVLAQLQPQLATETVMV